jgi:hypothetical protein
MPTEPETASITGFLLVKPSCIALQLEALDHHVTHTLHRLQSLRPAGLLTDWKVISMTDDIPRRAHNGLSHAYATGDTLASADAVDTAAAVKAASDINLSFIKFGFTLQCVSWSTDPIWWCYSGNVGPAQIYTLWQAPLTWSVTYGTSRTLLCVVYRPLKGVEREVALGNIAAYWDAIPKAEAVISLLLCEDVPTIAEFLAMFSGPVNIDFESEQVWPIPKIPEICQHR